MTHCSCCLLEMRFHRLATVRAKCKSPHGFGVPMTNEEQAIWNELLAEKEAAAK